MESLNLTCDYVIKTEVIHKQLSKNKNKQKNKQASTQNNEDTKQKQSK